MRLREPLLLGLIAFTATLLVSSLAAPWQEALAWGFAISLGYIIHQGSGTNGG